jgi:hypothetical protein
LASRLTHVLRFAHSNVAHLDRHAPYWPDDTTGIVTQTDKVVVETALLALLASRVSGGSSRLGEALAALVSLVAPLARSESNQVRLLRFPQTAASLGIAHICLSGLGNRDPDFDVLIRRAFSSGHVDAIERLPYRAMDLAWLRSIYGASASPGGDDGLLAHSVLGSCAHPVYMADMDAYALTHALMYLSDFGTRALPGIARERVAEMIDACLAWHLLTANMDLLGELLIAAALVGAPWSPYARLAMRIHMALWDEFGFLPSPAFDVNRYRGLTGDEARAYAFRHVYHTTYVAGILCQVLLRCPERRTSPLSWTCAQCVDSSLVSQCEDALRAARTFCSARGTEAALPVSGSGDDRSPVSVETTLDRTLAQIRRNPGTCGRPGAPWSTAVDGAPIGPADLALVLNDAMLIQAARDYDLSALAAALLERAASSLPVSRTLVEATLFLCRQQLSSGAIGAHFVVPANCSSPHSIVVTATLADCLARLLTYITESAHG